MEVVQELLENSKENFSWIKYRSRSAFVFFRSSTATVAQHRRQCSTYYCFALKFQRINIRRPLMLKDSSVAFEKVGKSEVVEPQFQSAYQ